MSRRDTLLVVVMVRRRIQGRVQADSGEDVVKSLEERWMMIAS